METTFQGSTSMSTVKRQQLGGELMTRIRWPNLQGKKDDRGVVRVKLTKKPFDPNSTEAI